MMRAGHNSRLDPLGRPHSDHKMADLRAYARQIPGCETEPVCILRVYPQRIRVGDFVEPFGVSRSGVNQSRETKRRHENELTLRAIEVAPVHMASYVTRQSVFRP